MSVKERDVEYALVNAVRDAGGIAYKFSSPARRNVPDRLVVLPGCVPFFVECKRPGEKPTKAQAREHQRLRDMEQVVEVIDTVAKADGLVAQIIRLRHLKEMLA